MSRRKESMKEKLRAEEHELDKQLREAGLYEEGMEFEMKRMMLQMLEESRKSAEQEEHQRQQWKREEDQILSETLNKSFKSNTKEKHEGEVGSSKEHGNEDNSRDSDVVAIPLDDGDPDCISGSGSVTPDFDHLCSGSPELMIPNVSPSIPSSIDSSAPAESGSYPLRGKTGGSLAKPHSSEEDLFCDSEGSKVLRTVNGAPKNFQQIGEITNSDAQKKAIRRSGLVDIVKKDVEKHESDSITSSAEDQGNFINKYQGIESRRPLRRRSSIEIVPSPSSKSEECSKRQIQHSSQPLFSSSDSRNSLGAEIEEEDGVQLISPLVRHRRSMGSSTTSKDIKNKGTSLQDAEVSNSLEVQVVQQTPETATEGDEDEGFLLPTPSASQSSDSRFQDHEVPSPMANDPLSDDPHKILQSHKRSQKEDLVRNEGVLQRSQVDICSTTDFSSKLNDEEEKENICSYMALSEHESLSFNYKKDRKRNMNVFFIEETPDVPLKRRRIEKTEVPSQAYFRKIKECPKDCFLRIMNMIDHMMKRLEKHQAENIYHKMKWPVPLTVDKRLKDSIDRPKVQSRRYITELETGVENEQMPRTPRLANKGTESFENASDDSLPDICQNDGGWIDTQEKKRGKKRGLHLGLSRKQPKLMALLEGKEGMLSSNQSNEKIIVYESDDDTDDFEIFPSNSSKQKPSACGQLELERYSTPKKDSKMECSEVSSSKVCDNVGDKNSEGVSDTENIQIDSQITEEGNLIDLDKKDTTDENELYRKETTNEKRQMTESPELSEVISKNKQCTSAESKIPNQPQRKSFMLTSDDSDDQSKASSVAASSTYSVQKLGTTKLQGFVSNMQRSTEQLRQQHTVMLRKLENCASGKHSQPAVKRDNSGRKINDLTYVSSSGRDGFESLAGPSSSADICIVEDNSSSTGGGSVESAKHMDKNPRKSKINRDPIRPAPLKLKKNRMGNKREPETSGNQLRSEIGAERITSSEGLTVQEFSDVEQVDNSIEKEDVGKEMVPCPLCQKFFPAEMIEVHASDCSEQAESPQKRTCQFREVSGKVRRKRFQREMEEGDSVGKQLLEGRSASGITTPGEVRPAVGQEKCSFCKKMFKEGDEYGIHVQSCESMKHIQDSIISPVGTRTPENKREVQHSSGHTPKRGMTGTNVRTGNLFDHLEGDMVCNTGDITDPAFRSPHIALVQILNCVAVRPHGLSQTLASVYPYCNSYSQRRAIGSLNRAIVDDRPQPGNIEICRPPSLSQGPAVVNIFGQYYMGKEKKNNAMTKKLINQLEKALTDDPEKGGWKNGHLKKVQKYSLPSDKNLLSGLLKDTTENRILWFREGLSQLAQRVPDEKFRQIIFPFRIGSGLAGGNWEKDYFPAIKEFTKVVKQYDAKVEIVRKVEEKSFHETAVIGTIRKTESKEEYEIPTSPIKNFIPISKQTNSLIDYHHQFRDKSQKLVVAGAVRAGAVRRGHKRRGTRKAEGNRSKRKK